MSVRFGEPLSFSHQSLKSIPKIESYFLSFSVKSKRIFTTAVKPVRCIHFDLFSFSGSSTIHVMNTHFFNMNFDACTT